MPRIKRIKKYDGLTQQQYLALLAAERYATLPSFDPDRDEVLDVLPDSEGEDVRDRIGKVAVWADTDRVAGKIVDVWEDEVEAGPVFTDGSSACWGHVNIVDEPKRSYAAERAWRHRVAAEASGRPSGDCEVGEVHSDPTILTEDWFTSSPLTSGETVLVPDSGDDRVDRVARARAKVSEISRRFERVEAERELAWLVKQQYGARVGAAVWAAAGTPTSERGAPWRDANAVAEDDATVEWLGRCGDPDGYEPQPRCGEYEYLTQRLRQLQVEAAAMARAAARARGIGVAAAYSDPQVQPFVRHARALREGFNFKRYIAALGYDEEAARRVRRVYGSYAKANAALARHIDRVNHRRWDRPEEQVRVTGLITTTPRRRYAVSR